MISVHASAASFSAIIHKLIFECSDEFVFEISLIMEAFCLLLDVIQHIKISLAYTMQMLCQTTEARFSVTAFFLVRVLKIGLLDCLLRTLSATIKQKQGLPFLTE